LKDLRQNKKMCRFKKIGRDVQGNLKKGGIKQPLQATVRLSVILKKGRKSQTGRKVKIVQAEGENREEERKGRYEKTKESAKAKFGGGEMV